MAITDGEQYAPSGPPIICLGANPNEITMHSVSGIVVSIAAFQAVDPGSIPG